MLMPRLCPACGHAMLEGEEAMCSACRIALPRLGPADIVAGTLADALSNAPAPPGFTAIWFRYDPTGPFARLVRDAKYADRPALARKLGREFARELISDRGDTLAAVDLLLPVPMHWQKQLRRGYNQSVEIAAGIADVTGIPIGDNLVAVAPHATQTHRSSRARLSNVRGTIACEAPHELHDLDICLVDDIVTTGATIGECIMALRRATAQPASIGAITLGAP